MIGNAIGLGGRLYVVLILRKIDRTKIVETRHMRRRKMQPLKSTMFCSY